MKNLFLKAVVLYGIIFSQSANCQQLPQPFDKWNTKVNAITGLVDNMNTDMARAMYERGVIEVKSGNQQVASNLFLRAIKLNPTESRYWYAMAKTQCLSGAKADAINTKIVAESKGADPEPNWLYKCS